VGVLGACWGRSLGGVVGSRRRLCLLDASERAALRDKPDSTLGCFRGDGDGEPDEDSGEETLCLLLLSIPCGLANRERRLKVPLLDDPCSVPVVKGVPDILLPTSGELLLLRSRDE
jgi:hypothetical protein